MLYPHKWKLSTHLCNEAVKGFEQGVKEALSVEQPDWLLVEAQLLPGDHLHMGHRST